MTTKKNLSAGSQQRTSESLLKDIRRNTKRIFTSEQKVLIVMEGIRGEQSSAILCSPRIPSITIKTLVLPKYGVINT